MVRVAALEPDPDRRPVRLRVGARGVAAGRHARRWRGRTRRRAATIASDPLRLPDADDLPPQRAPDDAGAARRAALGDASESRSIGRAILRSAGRAAARDRSIGRSPAGARHSHGPGTGSDPSLVPAARLYSAGTMTHGTVIIIGGAEDKVRDRVILGRFVALAGGRDAQIAVIRRPRRSGIEAGERYRAIFTELGAAEVRPLHAVTRAQANDEHAAPGRPRRDRRVPDRRQPAAAVVDDRRDPPRRCHHDAVPAGAVVAGTSAGRAPSRRT